VLLNSVLNAIPIYFLSYLKVLKKVWRRIVTIQREFLWGGVEGGRKINWVRWSLVCKPKEEGGPEVRDISVVNLSLLAKWRWRLIYNDNALWKDVLVEKYGREVLGMVDGEDYVLSAFVSRWWGDIVRMDQSNWFNEELIRRVGNGASTSFWEVARKDEVAFQYKYPILFLLSN